MGAHESRGNPAPIVAWMGVLLVVAALIHCIAQAICDQDTSYHIAVARLMRDHGMLYQFPWTPFSWLAQHYADKELLFHLLMMPLAKLPALVCARIVGSVLGFVLLATIFWILHAERVEQPGLWVLLGLLGSASFVLRFALVRPHLLSIALCLGMTWLGARKHKLGVALLGFAYPFCYIAWHLPVILLVIVELSRWLCQRKPDGSSLVVLLAGLGAGVLVHPHFPHNVSFFWLVNVEVLGVAWSARQGFEMGPEFASASLSDIGRFLLLPLLMSIAAAARTAWLWRRGERDTLVLAATAIALAFSALAIQSSRFVEYFAPFALVAFALSYRGTQLARAVPVLVLAAGLFLAVFGRGSLDYLRRRAEDFPEAEMALLRKAIAPGAQVVTCDWGLTGGLMLALPERKFVVALDPVLFWRNDPELYRFWFRSTHTPPEHPAAEFRRRMAGDFIVCDARLIWRPLVAALSRDPEARRRAVTPLWIAFDIRAWR